MLHSLPLHTGAQRRLTLESLECLVRRLDGARAQTSGTQVIPAFQTPVLEYDPIRKQFHASPAPPRLFPEAKVRCSCAPPLARLSCMRDRAAAVRP